MSGSYLITVSGRRVDVPNPLKGQVTVEDIAVHLSRIPRFAGATDRFFSVAQHSVSVAYVCAAIASHRKYSSGTNTLFMEGLFHDAHEYLTGDVPSPVKLLLGREWKSVEMSIDRAIRREFGLCSIMPADVHLADRVSFAMETQELRGRSISEYGDYIPAESVKLLTELQGNEYFEKAQRVVQADLGLDSAGLFLGEYKVSTNSLV